MIKIKSLQLLLPSLLGLLLLASCSNTKYLDKGEYLLQKNEIDIPKEKTQQDTRDIESGLEPFIKQKPNARFLFLFKTELWFYNIANAGKDNKFNNWIKEKLGEEPVIYDSSKTRKSTELIESYLHNKGYFFGEVSYEHKLEEQKAYVTYKVKPKTLYSIGEVTYPSGERRVDKIVKKNSEASELASGTPFDVDKLKAERERIANLLRNNGFYSFNKKYVYYDLDSSNNNQKVDVDVRIKSPSDSADHQVYKINKVFVYTDYSFDREYNKSELDTITKDEYHFIAEEHKYQSKVLINAIFFEQSNKYRLQDNKNTINALADLNIFKFINVKFRESVTQKKRLNVHIYLTPAKKQEMSVEVEVNNSTDYDLGSAVTYNYKNKNIFRGAELFNLNLTGGLETQFGNDQTFLNTLDFTGEARLKLPQFLVPFEPATFSKNNRPKTIFSIKYNYQKRINFYSLYSTNFSFGYEWRETDQKQHFVYPVVINQVELLQREEEFNRILRESPVLRSSFTNQRIIGANYTYIFSNQSVKPADSDFFFLKANLDLAGNLLHGVNWIGSQFNDKEPPYKILGRPYSQYSRANIDYRYYFQLGDKSKVVTRVAGGLGVPYGNADVLPYVKQFFTGGSNNIRAWRVRTLGPGSFNIRESAVYDDNDDAFIDQTGDMKLEANAEYRFDIFQMLKGAFFVDAGNIWLLEGDTTRSDAKFTYDSFYKEIAVGTGAGLRLDFDFFVIRFDVGLKTHDPSLPKGSKWVFRRLYDERWQTEFEKRNQEKYRFFNFNLSIGYPF